MLFTSLLAAAIAPLAVLAQAGSKVTITNPTAQRWWIQESTAEIAWTGDIPSTDITYFIFNDDVKLLALGPTGVQLNGIAQAYQKSINFELQPGINAGKGYTLKITNTLNSSIVYATSEQFEVKPKGSTYPPVPTTTNVVASSSAAAAAGGSASASASAGAGTTTAKGSAGAVTAPMVAVAAAGALTYFLA